MTAALEPESFSDAGRASLSACPACVAAPSAMDIARQAGAQLWPGLGKVAARAGF